MPSRGGGAGRPAVVWPLRPGGSTEGGGAGSGGPAEAFLGLGALGFAATISQETGRKWEGHKGASSSVSPQWHPPTPRSAHTVCSWRGENGGPERGGILPEVTQRLGQSDSPVGSPSSLPAFAYFLRRSRSANPPTWPPSGASGVHLTPGTANERFRVFLTPLPPVRPPQARASCHFLRASATGSCN